ncbi:hypothetical protein GA0070624_4644 [Micromonospora rhizosphaerae]|uniref:DUF3558 domain-containing protein n=1 Tax=Micromonospora rhizosphaerae TaxID=568872 RepID=A0A1C6SUR6_9ACTN|nr:hypothetical protein [Micromonospora rhizosphaerae]SCL33082.1 hypothetical protein GA0070624_4644 [Micromonospora rhizosphaerae]
MRWRSCLPFAAMLAATLTGCGWVGAHDAARVPGCTVPDDEDGLLDAYADDPVLAVRPQGARRAGDVIRSKGCERVSREDTTNTSVSLTWRLSRGYDDGALRRTFDPVAREAGWRFTPAGDRGPVADGSVFLTYCRSVLEVPSRLVIRSDPEQRVDVRPSTADRPPSPQWSVLSPAGIYVTIYADPTCPTP